jgi:molybdenum cofactor cytidylyltransferase
MTRMNPDSVSIIVLAPGLSTRFGRNRLLEPAGERTMIESVVSECMTSKADQVIVVCGHDADKVKSVLKDYKCDIVFDEDYQKGESYSVKKGLSRVNGDADAVIVLPGDSGVADRKTINAMIREYSSCYAPIITEGYRANYGRAILFDKNLFGELNGLTEESEGLASLLVKYRSKRRLIKSSEALLLRLDRRGSLLRRS